MEREKAHAQRNRGASTKIRSEISAVKASLAELKAHLAENTDKYVNGQLQQASNEFDDVEILFLGILKENRIPPRTLSEESRVLDAAELFLEVPVARLKAIQEFVAKFGPNLQSIG